MTPLKLTLPQRWIDLTAKQFLFVSRLWVLQYSEAEFLVKAFLMLTGLRVVPGKVNLYVHRAKKRPFIIDNDLLSSMVDNCRFLLVPGEVHPIPKIGFARPRHYRLYNATFEEYLMAENFYFAYTETRKDEHLNNLIACLYRRPWQKWDAEKIQARASRFRKTDPAIKNAVFMWYVGFRSYIPKRCKALFSEKGGGSQPFNARNYINGMVHSLSGGNITIKDKLLSLPCWDALDELEQRAIEVQTLNAQK